jgi:hypothetical protein
MNGKVGDSSINKLWEGVIVDLFELYDVIDVYYRFGWEWNANGGCSRHLHIAERCVAGSFEAGVKAGRSRHVAVKNRM